MSDTGGRRLRLQHSDADFSRFDAIDAWVFDLDNTLYPRHVKLYEQVDKRIADYVERLLKIPPDDADALRRDYYRRYGATLRGLMVEHQVDPDDFLDYVHDIDHSALTPNPALAAAIEQLPGPRFIFTNGSRGHAEKVAAKLGLLHHFEDIFDIVSTGHLPKPHVDTYRHLIEATGIDPARTAMFEDLLRNLLVPVRLGMTTVLVVPPGTSEVFHDEWEFEGAHGEKLDFVTDDLAGFLGKVLAERGARPEGRA